MEASLTDFIAKESFPCVMAKAVTQKGYFVEHTIDLNSPDEAALKALTLIYEFVEHFRNDPKTVSSFVLKFTAPELSDFSVFENFFWRVLGAMDREDKKLYSSDIRISSDPESNNFSFSLMGEAFFILALHPASPRIARRFSIPTIVFNAHQQFEDLREKGVFHKVRDMIRKRDIKLQGFINPMLEDFGKKSEVFQYLGKLYTQNAKCPFQREKPREYH